MKADTKTLIARNLSGVRVGDLLVVRGGEVFTSTGKKVTTDLTRRVGIDGEYLVTEKSGHAPGDVSYFA